MRTLASRWNLLVRSSLFRRCGLNSELVYTLRPTLSSACAAHIRFWCSRSHSCVDCLLVKSSPVWQRPDTVQLTTLCLTSTTDTERPSPPTVVLQLGGRAHYSRARSAKRGQAHLSILSKAEDIAHCRRGGFELYRWIPAA